MRLHGRLDSLWWNTFTHALSHEYGGGPLVRSPLSVFLLRGSGLDDVSVPDLEGESTPLDWDIDPVGSDCSPVSDTASALASSVLMRSGSSDQVCAKGYISIDSLGSAISTAEVPVLFGFDRAKVFQESFPCIFVLDSRYFFKIFQSHAAFDILSSR